MLQSKLMQPKLIQFVIAQCVADIQETDLNSSIFDIDG
jgi:hypothetical protein